MKIEFEKHFIKEVDKLKDAKLKEDIREAIEDAKKATKMADLMNTKKLKGFKTAYRIKTGNYRIGIFFQDSIITFVAFDHRKDFYKHFP